MPGSMYRPGLSVWSPVLAIDLGGGMNKIAIGTGASKGIEFHLGWARRAA